MQVSNLTGVVAIGTGRMHTLAAKSDGTVWAWGFNATGQLGNGNTTNQKVPVLVQGLTGATMFGGGRDHSVALVP